MKNTIQLSTLFFFILLIFACGNPDAENNNDETQTSDTTTVNKQFKSEARQKRAGEMPDSLTASQLIDMSIENLDERLSLSAEQTNQIRDIFLAEYMKSGNSEQTMLVKEEAKPMRTNIIRNTQNEVNAILSEEQREFYDRYIR